MHILIVENDRVTRSLYRKLLLNASFPTVCTESAEEALQMLEKENFDLMIQEVKLPGIDGFSFIKMLRKAGNELPILVTSACHTQRDIDDGLLYGADDYMAKPVEAEEFILRIKALLRRSRISTRQVLTLGSTVIDAHTRVITTKQQQYMLPHKEFDLLFFLLSYPGQVFSRDYLLNKIWGPDSDSEPATVSVHINRLRKHFSDNPDFSILTCRGSGYKALVPSRPVCIEK